ncbi:hypothetical protein EST38_g6651 [Candolleomyces aberdarensis]|uniref:Uncharacterized protein n=1 Tax=Candolleomyces aberdarensis TaxID=2316362 RepID=A0A4Q2DHM5_9AGAR|nr:hypothetical protein EST38_g6651 [Candolleomyces aberdarensis]
MGIPSPTPTIDSDEERQEKGGGRPRTPQKLRPDMIRRMDEEPPKLINPSGRVTGPTPQIKVTTATPADSVESVGPAPSSSEEPSTEENSPADSSAKHSDAFPRVLTVEFVEDLPRPRLRVHPTIATIAEHDTGDNGGGGSHLI